MKRILTVILLGFSHLGGATTYYVSSSTGNDSNSASLSAPWQTIGHVNGQTFQPGDSILFKRGDVWNESLAPASSGSSGNPITFDAYGAGAAPNLTGYYAVPTTAWVLVTGNAWKAALPPTYTTVNFCLFGSVWGQRQTVFSTSSLTAQWDFYFASGYLYVYSVGNPASSYNEPIVPMALSNVPVININGQSWLTFQHFLVNWFDEYGVYVQGTSDHLVFANMEADSMIPQGTQPLGFYVNEIAPGPGDIKIYNSEAHLNYDAFRFDGYVIAAPQYEYLGWGEQGPVYRYNVAAQSDEVLLDQKALPNRSPFVDRSAGNALRQLAQDLLPEFFDVSAVQNLDPLASYEVNPQKSFSFHAAEIAVASRGSFRTMNGALIFVPAGATVYALNESDANFSPAGLRLNSPNLLVNDVTVIGQEEPQALVRDYFAGDGLSLKFYLSQKPFAQSKPALIDEEYLGPGLDATTWVKTIRRLLFQWWRRHCRWRAAPVSTDRPR